MSEKLTRVAQQPLATVMTVSPITVDRMSLAHDIVMMTDSTIAIGIGSIETMVSKFIIMNVLFIMSR